ncbi:MAG: hypothetical protein PHC28_16470 [Flavobacterium sp.]|uniref:hypothetical protein n=1 Tax=Flavobacterium sp. TaxID=239 RepID=UPI0026248352|nr:hypothetical protein [Flavobacterium sp.]MDD5152047.1 hypothetical protein [Flavobacterium sp.]
MKKVIIFLMIIMAGVVIESCESNTYEDISFVANPTYTANVGPIVKSTCSGCHSGGQQFPNLESYAEVKDAIQNGSLLCRIDDPSICFGSIMPTSGRMPQTTIDMFILWQTQGFVN